MSFDFFLQELHQRVTEKVNAVNAHKRVMTVAIAAVLAAIVFFAVKTNIARGPAVGAYVPAGNPTQSAGSAAVPNGGSQNEAAGRTKTLRRIENVAAILGIAVLTSGGMIIYDKKKKNRVEALPVLRSEEETH